MSTGDARRQRQEVRLLQQQSVWMQKALFALRKVEDTRDRLADLHDEDADGWTLSVGGKEVAVADIEDAIEDRVREVLETVRERRGRGR